MEICQSRDYLEFKDLTSCLECCWTDLSLENNPAVDSETDLDLELHCEDDIGDYQAEDNQFGEDQAQNVQVDLQLNIKRISKYSDNRCSKPSEYNLSPEVLRSLQAQKVVHVQVDRHAK